MELAAWPARPRRALLLLVVGIPQEARIASGGAARSGVVAVRSSPRVLGVNGASRLPTTDRYHRGASRRVRRVTVRFARRGGTHAF